MNSVFKPKKSLWERCKEDPLVPVGKCVFIHFTNGFLSFVIAPKLTFSVFSSGCLVTAGILAFGLITMTRNQQHLSQRVMRARVVAQGATIALVGLGSLGFTAFMPKKTTPAPPTYQ
jgi:hypothetical protein